MFHVVQHTPSCLYLTRFKLLISINGRYLTIDTLLVTKFFNLVVRFVWN
jgi:hypothetical protein